MKAWAPMEQSRGLHCARADPRPSLSPGPSASKPEPTQWVELPSQPTQCHNPPAAQMPPGFSPFPFLLTLSQASSAPPSNTILYCLVSSLPNSQHQTQPPLQSWHQRDAATCPPSAFPTARLSIPPPQARLSASLTHTSALAWEAVPQAPSHGPKRRKLSPSFTWEGETQVELLVPNCPAVTECGFPQHL